MAVEEPPKHKYPQFNDHVEVDSAIQELVVDLWRKLNLEEEGFLKLMTWHNLGDIARQIDLEDIK